MEAPREDRCPGRELMLGRIAEPHPAPRHRGEWSGKEEGGTLKLEDLFYGARLRLWKIRSSNSSTKSSIWSRSGKYSSTRVSRISYARWSTPRARRSAPLANLRPISAAVFE